MSRPCVNYLADFCDSELLKALKNADGKVFRSAKSILSSAFTWFT